MKTDAGVSNEVSSDDGATIFAGRLVTVLVGEPPTQFVIHEDVIKKAIGCGNHRNYWGVIFNNGFSKTESGVVELPEDDAEAFEYFIQWAYGTASGFAGESVFFRALPVSILLKLYFTAEYLESELLADAIVTEMWRRAHQARWWDTNFTCEALEHFENNISEGCHMDNLLVDWMVSDTLSGTKGVPHIDGDTDHMPQRLVRAAFKKISQTNVQNGHDVPQMKPLCFYHLHDFFTNCRSACFTD